MSTLPEPPQPAASGASEPLVQALPEVPQARKRTTFFIPSKNKNALLAYYAAIFGIIPGLGLILGPTAQILGFMGLCKAIVEPGVRGAYHSIFSIALGMIVTLLNWVVLIVAALFMLTI
jgi:hypothetical protein